SERQAVVDDGADDRVERAHGLGRRRAQVDAHLVVAERVAELFADAGGQLFEVELAEDSSGALPEDRQLGHAKRLLGLFAARLFFPVVQLGLQRTHLIDELVQLGACSELGLPARERALRRVLQVLPAEWLDEVLERSVGQSVLHGVERRVRGDHHDLDARVRALDPPEQLDAVHLRHLDVHEHHVGVESVDGLERRFTTVGRRDLVRRLQDHPQGLPRSQFVIHDQDSWAIDHHDWVAAIKVAVKLTSLRPCLTSSRPPWASTMRWLTHGPTSSTLSCTTRIGSKMLRSSSARTSAVREATVSRSRSSPVSREIDSAILASAPGVFRSRYQTR